jgi:hypothetical protein
MTDKSYRINKLYGFSESDKRGVIRWKASGRYCGLGSGPTEGFLNLKLPLYLGFFEFVHNTRKRGKALLPSLLGCLLK